MIRLDMLREMPLFAALSEERMRWVCSQLEEVILAPGEVLMRRGEPSRGFFILLEGEIQVDQTQRRCADAGRASGRARVLRRNAVARADAVAQ